MQVAYAVILTLALVLGVNSLPGTSKKHLLHKYIPRHQLETRLRTLLAPGLKSALDDAIINFVDTKVRQAILEGSPDLGLPVLDPAKIENLDFDVSLDGIVLQGNVQGVTVTGASTFVLDKIESDLLSLRIDFAFHVPEVSAEGEHYNVDGNIKDLLPVYGEGPFSASVKGLTISGTVELAVSESDNSLYVKSLTGDASFDEVTVRFEGLLGGGAAGDLANDLINQLIPSLWEDVKGDIVTAAAEAIKNLANGLLEGVTLEDILDLINGAKLVKL